MNEIYALGIGVVVVVEVVVVVVVVVVMVLVVVGDYYIQYGIIRMNEVITMYGYINAYVVLSSLRRGFPVQSSHIQLHQSVV